MFPVHDRQGFTLIEVLISLIIIGIIMVGLQQALGTVFSINDDITNKQDLMARARTAMDRMVMFVRESDAITNPATESPEAMLKVAERMIDTYDNATHAYDIDGDGYPDADNDADGFINEGPGNEDPPETVTFSLDTSNPDNPKLTEVLPDYSTGTLSDYATGRILCEYVTLFECTRVDNLVEITLTLNDTENTVNLKTSVSARRWPEALPEGAFPHVFFYIADTFNHRIRKVDSETGIITTVAGTGTQGYAGDGGPATSAQINTPRAVFVDGSGSIYIADDYNHCIRKVDGSTGDITTVAGTGVQGYAGDGGPATSAQFNYPNAVWVDGSGNIYIGDEQNHRIRMVSGVTGDIETIVGTGVQGYSGDEGPATAAMINLETDVGLCIDSSGNIYIGDNGNHRVRKVDESTGDITTVAGTGADGYSGDGGPATGAALNYPNGVFVDGSGNVYIADDNNHRIRKVTAGTGVITTVAGTGTQGYSGDGGPAADARLNHPNNVWVDGSGNIFIADSDNSVIRKVDAATGIINTIAGTGSTGYSGDGWVATQAEVYTSRFICVSPN